MTLRIILFSLLSVVLFSGCQKSPSAKAENGAQGNKPVTPPVPQNSTTPTTTVMNCKTVEVSVLTDKVASTSTTTTTSETVENSTVNEFNIKILSNTKKSYDLSGNYESKITETAVVAPAAPSTPAKIRTISYSIVSQVEKEITDKGDNKIQKDLHKVTTLTGTNGYKFKDGDALSDTRQTDSKTTIVLFDDGHKSYTISYINNGKETKQDKEITTYTIDGSKTTARTELQEPVTYLDDAKTSDILQSRVSDCTYETTETPAAPAAL